MLTTYAFMQMEKHSSMFGHSETIIVIGHVKLKKDRLQM